MLPTGIADDVPFPLGDSGCPTSAMAVGHHLAVLLADGMIRRLNNLIGSDLPEESSREHLP